MTEEQSIQAELAKAFPAIGAAAKIARARRIFVDVPFATFAEVFDHLVKKMGFSQMSAITGFDDGATMSVMYHLSRPAGVMLNLKTSVPKEQPKIKTVTGYFPAADAYERELIDLLGFQVEGLGPGPRYPLPDEWPAGQYPLRKDWKMATPGGEDKSGGEPNE